MNPKSELVCDWFLNRMVFEDSLTLVRESHGTCMDWSMEKNLKIQQRLISFIRPGQPNCQNLYISVFFPQDCDTTKSMLCLMVFSIDKSLGLSIMV